jgi:hypothetical protein
MRVLMQPMYGAHRPHVAQYPVNSSVRMSLPSTPAVVKTVRNPRTIPGGRVRYYVADVTPAGQVAFVLVVSASSALTSSPPENRPSAGLRTVSRPVSPIRAGDQHWAVGGVQHPL